MMMINSGKYWKLQIQTKQERVVSTGIMKRNDMSHASQATIQNSVPMSAAQPHRQSVLIAGGKGLMDQLPKNSSQVQNQSAQLQSDRSNILRASANSQITGPKKYSYHQAKPALQGEKVGEYVTKEARIEKAQEIKSAHFKLGYPTRSQTMNQMKLEEEQNLKQKWNPQSVIAKTNLAVSNWKLGNTQTFDGLSQNKKDFPDHGAHYDPNQKAKRLELANQLRKSNLPPSHYDFPKTTAQDSYAQNSSNKDEVEAIKQRKEDAEKVFARVRGVKPNFSLGNHKLDYLSENKGTLKQHTENVAASKQSLVEQAANNRQHNFKMSFEQGNQFQADKGQNQPYKLPAAKVNEDRCSNKKGASNVHQVQLGDTRFKSDYQSLTAMQQVGHKNSGVDTSGLKTNASYKDVREKIAQQTKDLRASHFALGVHNQLAQASSASMYTAPPTQALMNSSNQEMREARERLQKSNFTLKDAHGGNGPATTTSQANNKIRQNQMASGQVISAQPVSKPLDSINFGQSRDYTSTAKSSFIGMSQDARIQLEEQQRFKSKFNKPNINLGSSPSKDTLLTQAQANDRAVARHSPTGSIQDLNAQNKENAIKMRGANFKMGSILPEHNNYKVSQLDVKEEAGTRNSARFQTVANKLNKGTLNSQTVSSGNNIAKGNGSFRTINQELTNWIQPSAVAK